MKMLILILMAILPSIVILRLVYKKDIEKEPIKLLLGMFGLGIISCFVTLQLTDILELIFPFLITEYEDGLNFVQLFSYVFISVALIEEFSKWLFNYTVVWNNKHFNHFYDSIVYSVFFSLGFATFENILYVLAYGFRVAILRAFSSVPAHAFFGITMGYYIGMSKLANYNGSKKQEKKYRAYSLLVPILLHGFYDFCLYSKNQNALESFFCIIISMCIIGHKIIKKVSSEKIKVADKEIK